MIKQLAQQDCKILKEIRIIPNKIDKELEEVVGTIFYTRDISDDYHIEPDENESPFLQLIEYPRQELFPQDEIDKLILTIIKLNYPNAYVANSLIDFESKLEKIERIKNQNFINAEFGYKDQDFYRNIRVYTKSYDNKINFNFTIEYSLVQSEMSWKIIEGIDFL